VSDATERNQIFRDRLITMMSELDAGEARDSKLRRYLGTYANRLAREAGTRDWADLKQRADGPTYDSLLQLFQRQSEESLKKGDKIVARTVEVLALSLIARRQHQADLTRGIELLDGFIRASCNAARRANAQFVPFKRP
jgi:hypothetical protein